AAEVEKLLQGDRLAREAEHDLVPEVLPGLARALAPLRDQAEDSAREDLARGTRLGAWRVERRLDSGGMGAVYLAQRADAQFEKTAAIKIVKRGMDSEQIVSRFALERSVLAKLDHPGIARLFDAGIVPGDGRPYLVMEYVDGKAIDVHCDERSLSIEERIALMQEVCDIVHDAHTKLVVHRDLKPSNVFVTQEGVVKLLDFGISKLLDPATGEGRALTDSLVGTPLTPDYASPEQVRGEAISTATDVYSLGVLFCELLSGSRPLQFSDGTRAELERVVSEREPLQPSRLVRSELDQDPEAAERTARARSTTSKNLGSALEGDLDNIVLKALSKEPGRRYASAQEFAQDLERFRAGLPVIARPDTGLYRATKFVRRNRAAVAATVAVVLALITGLVLSLFSVARTRAANREIARTNTELEHRQREILGLSDRTRIAEFEAEAKELWPAWPENRARMDDWLERADQLAQRLEVHQRTVERIRSEKGTLQPSALESVSPENWTFAASEDQWQHDTFVALLHDLERFTETEKGTVALVRERRERADELTTRMAVLDWQEAIERIADPFEFPQYEGLLLDIEMGLAPLGPDPDSGLYEFADLQTGVAPERDEEDRLIVDETTGIVFILIPGGEYLVGSQNDDPAAPHYDLATHDEETPVQSCRLDPFLVSKYEMTCA
ncbi:MAG: serine/threonine-protein kinase, partial [Planctomycetota bacterium]